MSSFCKFRSSNDLDRLCKRTVKMQTGDSLISNGIEKGQTELAEQGADEQATIISQFDPKLFYESDFFDASSDQRIFELIEAQNKELCEEFNENKFQFSVKNMRTKKIPDFINKFRSTDFFTLCFQIKGRTKGTGKSAKTVFDMRVGPDYLEEIDTICIMLDDRQIYRFQGDDHIEQFKKALNRHGFEFEKERVVGICFDVKHGYKVWLIRCSERICSLDPFLLSACGLLVVFLLTNTIHSSVSFIAPDPEELL